MVWLLVTFRKSGTWLFSWGLPLLWMKGSGFQEQTGEGTVFLGIKGRTAVDGRGDSGRHMCSIKAGITMNDHYTAGEASIYWGSLSKKKD